MIKRWAALGLVLAASAASVAAPAPGRQPPIERAPEFVLRVNAAIDGGVAFLKKQQSADGSLPGYPMYPGATTALAYCTLRACGVPLDDRSVKAAWSSLRKAYRREELRTYSAAVYLMAIAQHGEHATGAKDEHDVKLSKDDAKWAQEIVGFLTEAQDSGGRWGYLGAQGSRGGGEELPFGWDNSNTQYALLGLKSAARCGIAIDPGVWKRSLEHFIRVQEAAGPEVPRGTGPIGKGGTSAPVLDHARGWTYRERPSATGPADSRILLAGMTAGAVGSLVICRSELIGKRDMTMKLDAVFERAVWDGLAWLGTNWVPTGMLTPGPELAPLFREAMGRGLSLYEFYGVERAGVLAAVEWMAQVDWYGAGAASLLATQLPDGSWSGLDAGLMVDDLAARKRAMHPVDTCFALLFLKRGTSPVARGAVTQSGDESDINFEAAAKLTAKDLADFLDLVFARWRRATDADVKQRLFAGTASVGPRIVEPLLVRMDSPDAASREAAHALLRHATGLDFGYDAGASAEQRESAVVKWQTWWMGAKSRIAYDPTVKRLVVR